VYKRAVKALFSQTLAAALPNWDRRALRSTQMLETANLIGEEDPLRFCPLKRTVS
jgi:hypothetical protein